MGNSPWDGVDASTAVNALLADQHVLKSVGFTPEALEERWSATWSPQAVLLDCMLRALCTLQC